jgi:hypothetical protein
MNVVSRSQLRITMYNIMSEAKQNEFYDEDCLIVTKIEVMNFIESNPYFNETLKYFLKDRFIEDVDAMMVSEEWKEEFVKRVRRWAEEFFGKDDRMFSDSKCRFSILRRYNCDGKFGEN